MLIMHFIDGQISQVMLQVYYIKISFFMTTLKIWLIKDFNIRKVVCRFIKLCIFTDLKVNF